MTLSEREDVEWRRMTNVDLRGPRRRAAIWRVWSSRRLTWCLLAGHAAILMLILVVLIERRLSA